MGSLSIRHKGVQESFDRSVYPVPFNVGDLKTGAGGSGTTDQTEGGNVTMTVTVSDSDFTSDTLTTSNANSAGTILIKLIQGNNAAVTCFTAGSASSVTAMTDASATTFVHELGPLAETDIGSAVYEVGVNLSEEIGRAHV